MSHNYPHPKCFKNPNAVSPPGYGVCMLREYAGTINMLRFITCTLTVNYSYNTILKETILIIIQKYATDCFCEFSRTLLTQHTLTTKKTVSKLIGHKLIAKINITNWFVLQPFAERTLYPKLYSIPSYPKPPGAFAGQLCTDGPSCVNKKKKNMRKGTFFELGSVQRCHHLGSEKCYFCRKRACFLQILQKVAEVRE